MEFSTPHGEIRLRTTDGGYIVEVLIYDHEYTTTFFKLEEDAKDYYELRVAEELV